MSFWFSQPSVRFDRRSLRGRRGAALVVLALAASTIGLGSALAASGPNDPASTPVKVEAGTVKPAKKGSVLWAVVNSNGTLARSRNTASSGTQRLGTGTYQVIFKNDVTGCAFLGTVGQPGAGTTSGDIDVAARAGNAQGVFVETRDNSGTLNDRSFHLVVTC